MTMKKPASKTTPPTAERKQGTPPGKSGINTPVKREKVPQVRARTTYGKPTQTQKM